jgi:hypothetical protein
MDNKPGHTIESLNEEREHYRERAHRAEAENKRLREALHLIATDPGDGSGLRANDIRPLAIEAFGERSES